MQRVLILGPCGTGKSTLARRIGPWLGLPVFHLDKLFWQRGWIETPAREWERCVRRLVAEDAWIIDGTYSKTLDMRLARADTAIVLDLPRRIYMTRVLRRIAGSLGHARWDLPLGCPEHLDWPFLRFVWRYHRDQRPGLMAALERHAHQVHIHRLRSPRQVRALLRRLETAQPGRASDLRSPTIQGDPPCKMD